MATLQDVQFRLKQFTNKVQNNVTIVTPDTLQQDCVYHIAWQRFSYLVPNVSRRASPTEDNTVPRIHTALSLLGCLRGYAGITWQIFHNVAHPKVKAHEYKGGWYLFSVPFDYALAPNTKLVFDSDYTKEHWLITYDAETRTYKPRHTHRFYFTKLEVIPLNTGKTENTLTLLLEIIPGATIHLTDDGILLKEGYYKVILNDVGGDYNYVKHSKISASDFTAGLERHTVKLGLEHQLSFQNW